MLVLVALDHPRRTLADLRGKLGRCRGHDGSILLKGWSRRQTRGGSNATNVDHTAHLTIDTPEGYGFTSESGALPSALSAEVLAPAAGGLLAAETGLLATRTRRAA
jgi:hypothetical protein